MAGFDKYPSIDENFNFPPEIREAAAHSEELNSRFDTEVSGRFTTVQQLLDGIKNTREAYNYRWANAAAQTAQTGMRKYDTAIQLDTGQRYEYTGTEWLIRASTLPILNSSERTAMLDKFPVGTLVLDPYGTTFRWSRNREQTKVNGIFGSAPPENSSYSWIPWESDWYDHIPTFGGLSGSAYATPGWTPGGMYRYTSGKVRYHFGFNLNSTMTPGGISVNLPVNAARYGIFNSGTSQPGQDGLATTGRAWRRTASRWYDFALVFNSDIQLGFMNANGGQYMDGQGGGQWLQSETLLGVIEYEHW